MVFFLYLDTTPHLTFVYKFSIQYFTPIWFTGVMFVGWQLKRLLIKSKYCKNMYSYCEIFRIYCSANDIFNELKIFKVRDVIKMHKLRVSFDFLHNSLPSDLMTLFQRSSDIHPNLDLNSSVNELLYIPRVKTIAYGIKSIKYSCAKLWNDYFKNGKIQVKGVEEKNSHISLNKIRSAHNFKNAVKRHFVHSYSIDDSLIGF